MNQTTSQLWNFTERIIAYEAQVDPQEFASGRVEVLAHWLGLLAAFIGDTLMLRPVREVWPRLPLKDYFDQ